jgi:UDP-N-acetylmuramoyl-L-alanyl-D-glutamate--2,6-diaminopimelate ligase
MDYMRSLKRLIPQEIKNIYHLGQAILANLWYGFPSHKIKVIGVTGTNGKTTVCQMIAKILEEAGNPVKPDGHEAGKVAMISTINFKLGKKEWANDTKYTTLSSFKVQKFIKQAAEADCEYIIIETSSHSLDQNRVWGIDYDAAVITNITREHLDYHRTMEKYRQAKLKLFKKARVAVVNLDMEKPEEFLSFKAEARYVFATISNFQFPISNKFSISSYQINKVAAEDIELGINYSAYKLKAISYKLYLPGLFNVENALAATCVGLAYGINLETIAKALEKIKGIPGRLEFVPNDKGLNIIIDYAVTPDSLEKLYNLVKDIRSHLLTSAPNSRIIAVFGACGERDRGKRPIMGEIVSHYADYIILTNEDPYDENPVAIINQVFSGVVGHDVNNEIPNFQFPTSNFQSNPNDQISNAQKIEGVNCWRIIDRREAIKKALQIAKPGDFVVVTGKGAEVTMAMGDKRIPWNDKKVIQEVLRELSSE